MRLLQTTEYILHEFHGRQIPPYVILSHTWEQEEVSFEDIQTPDCMSLAGYEKIIQCCKFAAARGWEYIWIDTCCIDKRSSAELSEAINSMFRWYQEAQVCYTYLSDVLTISRDDFCCSRWFTRGWTLQELLAPGLVTFVNAFWEVLDTKRSLWRELSSVTGISPEHLIDPSTASTATKMSWASRRETTRLEDVAYCLLGLFDVNMPLMYGEGDKAFMRLQHEIVRVLDDESIFAWCDPGLVRSGLFARSPAAFAGSGDIVPIHFSALSRSGLYTVTNRGLAFENMALIPTFGHDDLSRNEEATPEHLAPLRCARLANKSTPLSLVLRESPEDENTMTRVLPWELHPLKLHQCRDSFSYRTLYVKPTFTTSALSKSVHSQNLILRFLAVVESKWSVICVYNGDLPTKRWWKGWNIKLHHGDLPDVLKFGSSDGDHFYLILKSGLSAPRVHLLVPQAGADDSVGSVSLFGTILEVYRDIDGANDATADSYCQTLQSERHCVLVLLSKQCIEGRVRFILDVSVKALDDVQKHRYPKLDKSEESEEGDAGSSGSEAPGKIELRDIMESDSDDGGKQNRYYQQIKRYYRFEYADLARPTRKQ
ncbi:MAG: hypothetical protein Q9222_004397 [Ikaeria aurantiellina]